MPAAPADPAARSARRATGALAWVLLGAALAQTTAADPPPWDALWERGRRREALELMQAALERSPGDEALRRTMAWRQFEVHQAQAALATAAPLGPELDALRATALYVLGRYEEALPLLDPAQLEQALMQVDALEALGRLLEADEAAARAAERHGAEHVRLLAYRGRRAAQQGRPGEAVALFESALALDPIDVSALYGLGQALVRSGRRDEGLAVLERHRRLVPLIDRYEFARQALDLDASVASNHAAVGDVERELGLIELAEQRYRTAAALAREHEVTPVALRHARLLAEDRGDVAAAVALLDAAAARAADPRLPVRAGDLLLEVGQPQAALQRYEAALQRVPGEPQIVARREQALAALRQEPASR